MHSQTVSQSAFSSRSQRQSAKTHRQVYGLPCCYRQLQPDFHQLSQFEPVSDRLQNLVLSLKARSRFTRLIPDTSTRQPAR
ncbi:MAG: hypothetical protein HC886_18830 [Leptolyngbyaceae cyanobacterium SM1_1_3]|nr:hypothetical protein [Leptolyngbyaceae cyanobacterium SM1_1_3]